MEESRMTTGIRRLRRINVDKASDLCFRLFSLLFFASDFAEMASRKYRVGRMEKPLFP
jgi:hypothetical protein